MRAGNIGGLRPNGRAVSTNGFTPQYTETVAKCDNARTTKERLVADRFEHPASDIYGLLRTQVLQRMKKHNMSTVAVTGGLGSGVTTTAANLAVAIALDVNQTVLLVDSTCASRDPRQVRLRAAGRHRRLSARRDPA